MATDRKRALWSGLALAAVFTLAGCQQVATTGGRVTGDADPVDDDGTPRPPPDECLVEDALGLSTPAGQIFFPSEGATVGAGEVSFLWSASDFQNNNLLVTVLVSDQPNVFDATITAVPVCADPQTGLGRTTVAVPNTGTFYWALEISDGTNVIRRPADGLGVEFTVSASVFGGRDDIGAFLLCPSVAARPVTTFQWLLLDEVVPTRTQVFVSRAGEDRPFDSPLSVFEVTPPTATSFALAEADALPQGAELSWGLRVETGDSVLFSFEGQLGESFLVGENIPPSGELLSPEQESVWADNTEVFTLSWDADPGNCEDTLTSTVFFELLDGADGPADLFNSIVQLEVAQGSLEVNVAEASVELDLAGGLWAWGVLADDGTDPTELPDSDDAGRLYRTFVRDTSPRFTTAAAASADSCGTGPSASAITFAAADDNGADTVTVTVTFAEAESAVFSAPEASIDFALGSSGSGPVDAAVFLAAVGDAACAEFAQGPGFYGIELDDGVNDPVRQIVEVALDRGPIGACCAADAGCAEVAAADCDGAYQGDATSCADTDCAISKGACCLPDDTCTEGSADECIGGQYQGDGTTCDQVACGVAKGACCLPDGICQDLTSGQCAGSYRGDGTSCATVDCNPPPAITDCNVNGIEDANDIASGTSVDCNVNGIPDECEDLGVDFSEQRLYVDAGATGGDGSSWAAAFNDLQAALAAAPPGTAVRIWVAAGTYTPAEVGSPANDSFVLLDGVFIHGGFNGTEDCLNQRDPSVNETILSGDINGDDDAGGTSDNSGHVVTVAGVGASVLDGFTITAGITPNLPVPLLGTFDGGGLHCVNASPTIIDCLFEGNRATQWGGGAYIENGSPAFFDCTFTNNLAGDGGGGLYCVEGSPTLTRCNFTSNQAADGGGMYNDAALPSLTGCSFSGNTSTFDGGGLISTGGEVTLAECTFSGNQADSGGAISGIEGDVSLVNCLVTGNFAVDGAGGGMLFSGTQADLTNCTFANNDASGINATGEGGGLYAAGDFTVINSIFWGNTDDFSTLGLEDAQITLTSETAVITYTCIQGLSTLAAEGNIGQDPLFDGGGFTLSDGSPCVNAGSNYASSLPATDIVGDPRIQNCRVDMGAFESPFEPPLTPLTDCNDNGVLDDCDIFGDPPTSADVNPQDHVPDECQAPL